jgi:hypothetical protein
MIVHAVESRGAQGALHHAAAERLSTAARSAPTDAEAVAAVRRMLEEILT